MNKNCHYIILFCWCILGLLPWNAQATHMVGGEINYRCLGNDQYEIMVTVFRDCDTGVPWFDNPASIGVFDINDSLIYDLRLTLRNNDTLDLNLSDPCLVAPPNVCIHTTTYLDTVTLPFQVGGYQIVYQRCCRNQDIVNIVAPTSTGATYSSYISEEALLGCNSSARFKEWPPVYVCAGVPIVYDHSAVDADGDSVVYELCTPFTGATASQSMPQPPNNPPYNNVTWLPPYSVDNMLGGPDSLKINSVTGQLTGTPDIIGVFVVGVCAKEYRNGVLISTTRRDFQYVVGTCGRLVSSAFFAPDIQCDNSLIVNFQNNSTSLGTGFVWSFGDLSNPTTSTVSSPSYIYPDTGYYTITLIADPGTLCADTSIQEIYLQYESISAGFDLTTANCTDSFFLDITDLTIDSISSIVQWDWDFGNGETDTIPFPSTVYDSSGTYIIELNVVAANGCTASYFDTINLSLPMIFSFDTVGICPGDSIVQLNQGGDTTHFYTWAPSATLSSSTVASPFASPTTTTTYTVTVVAPNGIDTCILVRDITVVISPPIDLDVIRDTITCADSVALVATALNATLIEWSGDPNFNTILFTGDTLNYPVTGFTRLFVRAINNIGCEVVDTVDIFKRTAPIIANWTYSVLACDSIYTVQFTDQTTDTSGGSIVEWAWSFGDGNLDTVQNPIHSYNQSGSYLVAMTVTTDQGCTGKHETTINVALPTITSSDTVGICVGTTNIQLNAGGDPNLTYQWSPRATLSDSNAVSPIANPAVPTTYTVTITAINGLDTCVNITQVHVNFPPPVTVSLPNVTTYCGSQVTLTATSPTAISYDWAGDPSFFTILGTGNPYTATPSTFPFAGYYVRATDPYGCTATAFALVEQNLVPVNVDFSYQSLGCSDTIAIQFTDLTADTTVSPITSWLWTTSDGQSSTLQHPNFVFTQSQATVVTLDVTLANGCTGTLSDTLQLNIASLTNDSLVVLCDGDSITTLNQGGNFDLTYQWSPGIYLNDSTKPDPIATPPTTPFTYTVTVTGASAIDSCVAIHDVTIIQAPPITLEVPKDTVVCSGVFNVQATVANISQIEWAFTPTFNPVAITGVTSFYVGLPGPPFTLSMYVRVVDNYGCTANDTVRIIRQNITLPLSFVPQINACSDTLDVDFINTSSLPSGLQVSNYNWNFGNGTTANSINGAVQYTTNGPHVVTLSATSTNGCNGSYTDSLVYQLPVINSADSIGLCGSDSVQLNQGGNPNLIYQWSPSTGLSDPTAASPIASPDTTTTYTVTVTAVNGMDTCQGVHDIVVGADSFLFEVMNDTVLCVNQIILEVNAPTISTIDWALDRDFNFIIGQSNPLFTSINDSRWFYVRGIDQFGCEGMDSVFVNYRGDEIPVDFSMLSISCEDSLVVQFQETTGDTTITNWNWNLGNGISSTLQNPSTTYLNDSTYTVSLSVEAIGNCTGQATQPLVAQLPELEVPNGDLVTCGNDSILLAIQTKPNLTYEWSPVIGLSDPNAASPMALPPVTTTYRVRVYGYSSFNSVIDTCFLEDSITIQVQPAPNVDIQGDSIYCDSVITLTANSTTVTNYVWSTSSDFQTIISTNNNLSTILSQAQQTYYIEVEDSLGCRAVDSLLVEQRVVGLQLDPVTANCTGSDIMVVVDNVNPSDSLSYTWSPANAIVSGQGTDTVLVVNSWLNDLTVIATNQFGCTDSVSTTIVLAPPLDLMVTPDTIVCESTIVVAASSTTTGLAYQWSSDPTFNIILGQNPVLQTNAMNNQNVYYIQVEDSLGCTKEDSIVVGYYPATVALDSASIICENIPVQLTATNLNTQDTLTYQWTPINTIVTGQGTNTVMVTPSSTTVYTVTAQNQHGCSTVGQGIVTVSNYTPPLSITAVDDTLLVGESTQLLATQQLDYQYTWAVDSTLIGDTIFNPTAQPLTTTTYYLTITDALGCSTYDSITVYINKGICDEPNVFVPNAFSPDNDGHNDLILVEGTAITEVYFVIYNRWGEKVFETNDQSIGWDGRYKGKDCPPDVYGYYMQCKCLDGDELIKKGNITLLR